MADTDISVPLTVLWQVARSSPQAVAEWLFLTHLSALRGYQGWFAHWELLRAIKVPKGAYGTVRIREIAKAGMLIEQEDSEAAPLYRVPALDCHAGPTALGTRDTRKWRLLRPEGLHAPADGLRVDEPDRGRRVRLTASMADVLDRIEADDWPAYLGVANATYPVGELDVGVIWPGLDYRDGWTSIERLVAAGHLSKEGDSVTLPTPKPLPVRDASPRPLTPEPSLPTWSEMNAEPADDGATEETARALKRAWSDCWLQRTGGPASSNQLTEVAKQAGWAIDYAKRLPGVGGPQLAKRAVYAFFKAKAKFNRPQVRWFADDPGFALDGHLEPPSAGDIRARKRRKVHKPLLPEDAVSALAKREAHAEDHRKRKEARREEARRSLERMERERVEKARRAKLTPEELIVDDARLARERRLESVAYMAEMQADLLGTDRAWIDAQIAERMAAYDAEIAANSTVAAPAAKTPPKHPPQQPYPFEHASIADHYDPDEGLPLMSVPCPRGYETQGPYLTQEQRQEGFLMIWRARKRIPGLVLPGE